MWRRGRRIWRLAVAVEWAEVVGDAEDSLATVVLLVTVDAPKPLVMLAIAVRDGGEGDGRVQTCDLRRSPWLQGLRARLRRRQEW